MSRAEEYIQYHIQSAEIGDIDPSYGMLRYVCDRFELNMEQRYWLAFLYASCYCGATTYWIYNEFPDYENVDIGRVNRWWVAGGRERSLFQTDRRWVRSRNQFAQMVESYRNFASENQQAKFESVSYTHLRAHET